MECTRRHFDTWQAWLDYACVKAHDNADGDYKLVSRAQSNDAPRHHLGNCKKFFGTATFEDAEALARKGWRRGAQQAEAFRATLTDRIVGKIEREELVFDTEGTGYDVARLLHGEPEHWQRWETTNETVDTTGTRCVRIIMNGTVSGSVDKATITARGAAVAALTSLLEYAGHNVRLDVVFGTKSHYGSASHTILYFVTVKNYGQPLDMGTIAFATAHASSQRRLFFSAKEHEPKKMRDVLSIRWEGSYGYPYDLPKNERDGALYVPAGSTARGGRGVWSDPNTAEAWVLETLRAQGVRLVDEQGV